jgi:predicted glycosyl hydrolase (DUF1957 family)
MAFDIKKNVRNKDLEEQGTWMDYDEGVRFLVARKNNSKYKGFISKKYRENERLVSNLAHTDKADKVSEQIMLEATATYLLLDWQGLESDGKALPYSKAVAMEVLDAHDELREAIEEYASVRDNYIAEKEVKDAENLKK